MARPASTAYVLRRMAARHKAAVTVGVLALVAVIAASAVAFLQRQAAVREQARAELLFRDGRQLANALIFKVHDAVAKLPGSTEVRRTIVNDAVAYLERLEAQSGGDPTMRLELAFAFTQIAGILGDPQRPNLGDRDAAIRQYQRSQRLSESLLSDQASFEVVDAFARAGHRVSMLHGMKGDQATAADTARTVVDQAKRYEQRHPADARGAKLVAESNFYLAWSLPVADSVPVWQQALAYYDGQLAKAPESAEHRRNTALMCKYLAGRLYDLGKVDEAERMHRRALELDEARLAAAPADPQTRLDVAISNGQMGEFLQLAGHLGPAAERFARSVSLRREAVAADPKDVMARGRLAYGLMTLGKLRRQQGMTAEARDLLREAIAVQEDVVKVTGDMPARLQLADLWFETGLLESEARQEPAACDAYRRARPLFSAAAQSSQGQSYKDRIGELESKVAGCAG
jgi:non-specific serine/threonine protein kinase/serine/threonine-protein kinase